MVMWPEAVTGLTNVVKSRSRDLQGEGGIILVREPKLGDKMSQKRLCWYGHVARSSHWINQCLEIEVEGPSKRGRYSTWKGTVKAELRTRNLSEADVFDRKIWRKRVSEICKPCP